MRSTTMRRVIGGATALGASLALAGGGLAAASTGSDTGTLDGSLGSSAKAEHTEYGMNGWDDCPIEDMLNFNEDGTAPPQSGSCFTFVIRDGSMQLGNIDIELEPNSMMIAGGKAPITGPWQPDHGSLHANPVTVPGGAIGTGSEEIGLLGITAYVEEAGTPVFNNDLADMWMGLPIKIRLSNPLLGDSCYIGSDENPIDLRLQVDPDTLFSEFPWTGDDGNSYLGASYPNAEASDTNFDVPGASGCGPFGSLNWAANLRAGLPSGEGNNSIEVRTSFYSGPAFQIWNQSLGG